MIIFGTRIKTILTHLLTGIVCPNCNAPQLYVVIFQKIAHIFWLPLFPIGKTGATSCAHCKQVLKENEVPPHIKPAYMEVKAHAKTPISAYWGVVVLIILIIIGNVVD